MKVYCPPDNHKLAKILFVAKLKGIYVEVEHVPYNHRNKQLQEQNALFSLPALQITPGQYVFGTHSIMKQIWPLEGSLFIQAQTQQWLQLIQKQLEPAVGILLVAANQLTEVDEQKKKKAKENVLKFGKLLQDKLKLNTFLVRDSLGIADISAFLSWWQIRQLIQQDSKLFVNIKRWSAYMASLPQL